MKNLIQEARSFMGWIDELKQVTSDATNTPVDEIKINEETAFEYYSSGFSPSQCFREEWANDGN